MRDERNLGNVTIRFPAWMKAEIADQAKKEKRTRSDWIRIVLEEALEAKKGGKK